MSIGLGAADAAGNSADGIEVLLTHAVAVIVNADTVAP